MKELLDKFKHITPQVGKVYRLTIKPYPSASKYSYVFTYVYVWRIVAILEYSDSIYIQGHIFTAKDVKHELRTQISLTEWNEAVEIDEV